MVKNFRRLIILSILLISSVSVVSCKKRATSSTTGWRYNDASAGGFQTAQSQLQETGPGLIFIEGGQFTMGRTEQDVMFDWNNRPRKVTVSSFYMDETEVRNIDYLEYLFWVQRVFGETYPQKYVDALPDTLVWRSPLAFNEPYVQNYLRHPAYADYPVVGVSWVQANEYAAWRTDRVNEMILVREGIITWNTLDQKNHNNFNTEAYLAGQYDAVARKSLRDASGADRKVRWSDGILLPSYRLPTEAEWEFAAVGLIGTTEHEIVSDRKLYPWGGSQNLRSPDKKSRGNFLANFKRGRGDYMGVAGSLNDGGAGPVEVHSFWPNDYGLYNMAGNVNEWVLDVYRPLTFEDIADLRPFRGNQFQTLMLDQNGKPVPKDEFGRLIMRDVTQAENETRRNYRKSDYRDYRDGDFMSSLEFSSESTDSLKLMYEYGVTSLINNESRVFKGGGWNDQAFWLVPGNRRFLDQNEAAADIGFRCAMIRVGDPEGPRRKSTRK